MSRVTTLSRLRQERMKEINLRVSGPVSVVCVSCDCRPSVGVTLLLLPHSDNSQETAVAEHLDLYPGPGTGPVCVRACACA